MSDNVTLVHGWLVGWGGSERVREEVADRIWRPYGKPAAVVHFPVDVERFLSVRDPVPRESWFLAGGCTSSPTNVSKSQWAQPG